MRSRNPEPLWRDVVGRELRARRRVRGDTLQDVARRAGVSPQYLSEMERGRKEPSSEMLAAVAGALESSLLDLTAAAAEQLRERARSADTGGEQLQSSFLLAA
ncbi:helix-turn-helix domain-containing protein [Curtobacterium sp. PhB137]|uniref:helix-turn-helix domain-containing protein n=1 Tax=Curtobacterium sp. PhB137 TaxID=2485182 RepID=UPI000F4EF2EA|nr:helix-turn-helix transcriptional regulator [Curtobacterium sp. PhB137]